jgi:hypothetical protein
MDIRSETYLIFSFTNKIALAYYFLHKNCQVIPKFYSATYKERSKLHTETGQDKLAQKIYRVHWVHGTHAYRAYRRSYPQWKSTVQLQYVHCYVVLTRN